MWERVLWERVLRAIARRGARYRPQGGLLQVRYRPQGGLLQSRQGGLLQQVLCGQHFLVDGDIGAGSKCLHKRDKISDT